MYPDIFYLIKQHKKNTTNIQEIEMMHQIN